MITASETTIGGSDANPLDPRLFRQVYGNGTQYIGIETSDALVTPLVSGVTSAPNSVLTSVWTGSFTFTKEFFGTMAFSPNSFPDGLTQGIWRTHDSNTRWSDIETSQGVYNQTNLGYLDYIVSKAQAVGAQIMYTVYKTPTWAAVGEVTNAPPTSQTYLTNWINFLFARYGNVIKYWEGWNEPNIAGSFTGNIAALVQHQNTMHTAVKANNASAVVISPSFAMRTGISSDTLSMANFFAAGGASYCDRIGYHFYKSFIAPTGLNGVRLDFDRGQLPLVAAQMASSGVSKPLSNTETGSSTPTFNRLLENFIFSAVYCDMSLVYSWDSVGYDDMRLSQLGVSEWNRAVAFLNGKTMTAVNQFGNGDFAVILNGTGYLVSGLGNTNT